MATNTGQPGAHRIPVQCSCGKRLVALSEHAGKQVKCPACGQPVAIPLDSSTQTTPSVPSVSDEAEGISKTTLIGMWTFAGVFALGCMVFLLWYNHSSNQARITAANDRLSQAVATANEWIAGTSSLNGETVEHELADALNNDDATETADGESVLSKVRIEQGKREAAAFLNDAKQQIDGDRIAEAVELLQKYLANPHVTARADAQRLLVEAETAVSDELTLDALSAMSDEELKRVEATGLIDDGKVTHPRLLAARKETIQRNVKTARQQREDMRVAEETRREAERLASMERKRQAEAEEDIRRREQAVSAYRSVPQSARIALNAAKKLQARTEIGINYGEYSTVVGETWGDVKVFADSPEGRKVPDFSELLVSAISKYKLGLEIWKGKLGNSDVRYDAGLSDIIIQECWRAAGARLTAAQSLIGDGDIAPALSRSRVLRKADEIYEKTIKSKIIVQLITANLSRRLVELDPKNVKYRDDFEDCTKKIEAALKPLIEQDSQEP